MKITLDAQQMATRKAAHAYLKDQLSFTEYYGANLDALHDCLEELADLEVEFINIPEEETYFSKVLRVFKDVDRRGDEVTVLEAEE